MKSLALPIKVISKSHTLFLFLLVVLLASPSLYLFLTFRPLWRDSDGFYQVYAGFSEFTILHWPPLYCFLARIPIALGQIINSLFSGQGLPAFRIAPPIFTDLGIYLLIFSQHVLLIGTLFFICVSLTRSWLVRILIAGLFALSPPLYAFAHSVGSESLSNILTLLSAVLGYKLLRAPAASRTLLFWFVAALVAAILTRHVNTILVGLVPGTYILVFGFRLLFRQLNRLNEAATFQKFYLRLFLKSLLLAVLSIVIAHLIVLEACRISKISYRSRVGYTFEWRLFYLANLSRQSQETVLEMVDRNLHDPAVSFALTKGQDLLKTTNYWDASVLHLALYEWLADHGVVGWKRIHLEADQRLNRICLQFLLGGGSDFWEVVMRDFWTSLNYSPADIGRDAFRTTDIFVQMSSGPAFVPVRHLSTLKPRRESYESEWAKNPYLTIGQGLPMWAILLALLGGALWLLFFRRAQAPEISLYAVSLTVTGIVISIANCALSMWLARFTLPLYILVLFGLAMVLAIVSQPRTPTA